MILIGATLLAVAWLRSRPSGEQLVYKKVLKDGQGLQVKFDSAT